MILEVYNVWWMFLVNVVGLVGCLLSLFEVRLLVVECCFMDFERVWVNIVLVMLVIGIFRFSVDLMV